MPPPAAPSPLPAAASQGLLDSFKETAGSAVDAVKGVASTAVDRAQQAAGAAKDAAGSLVDRATGALGMGDEAPVGAAEPGGRSREALRVAWAPRAAGCWQARRLTKAPPASHPATLRHVHPPQADSVVGVASTSPNTTTLFAVRWAAGGARLWVGERGRVGRAPVRAQAVRARPR